jgi:hypothetical protein
MAVAVSGKPDTFSFSARHSALTASSFDRTSLAAAELVSDPLPRPSNESHKEGMRQLFHRHAPPKYPNHIYITFAQQQGFQLC